MKMKIMVGFVVVLLLCSSLVIAEDVIDDPCSGFWDSISCFLWGNPDNRAGDSLIEGRNLVGEAAAGLFEYEEGSGTQTDPYIVDVRRGYSNPIQLKKIYGWYQLRDVESDALLGNKFASGKYDVGGIYIYDYDDTNRKVYPLIDGKETVQKYVFDLDQTGQGEYVTYRTGVLPEYKYKSYFEPDPETEYEGVAPFTPHESQVQVPQTEPVVPAVETIVEEPEVTIEPEEEEVVDPIPEPKVERPATPPVLLQLPERIKDGGNDVWQLMNEYLGDDRYILYKKGDASKTNYFIGRLEDGQRMRISEQHGTDWDGIDLTGGPVDLHSSSLEELARLSPTRASTSVASVVEPYPPNPVGRAVAESAPDEPTAQEGETAPASEQEENVGPGSTAQTNPVETEAPLTSADIEVGDVLIREDGTEHTVDFVDENGAVVFEGEDGVISARSIGKYTKKSSVQVTPTDPGDPEDVSGVDEADDEDYSPSPSKTTSGTRIGISPEAKIKMDELGLEIDYNTGKIVIGEKTIAQFDYSEKELKEMGVSPTDIVTFNVVDGKLVITATDKDGTKTVIRGESSDDIEKSVLESQLEAGKAQIAQRQEAQKLKVGQTTDQIRSRNLFQFPSIRGVVDLGWSGYKEWMQDVDRFFAANYLGTDYWVSGICEDVGYDIDQPAGVALIQTQSDTWQLVAHVSAEKSKAGAMPCDENAECPLDLECQNDGLCYKEGKDVPEESFFYKISWGVTAPRDEEFTAQIDEDSQPVTFNLQLKGSKDIWLFANNNTGVADENSIGLDNGERSSQYYPELIVDYSLHDFDEICVIWGDNKPKTFDDWSATGSKSIGNRCNTIVKAKPISVDKAKGTSRVHADESGSYCGLNGC